MTLPRSNLVSPETTPYYHCISRCVRRAFLCGHDELTGRSFEHRRDWIVKRLATLSSVFAIDICAYAVMSNHHHLVLRLNPESAETWSTREVLGRWCTLFKPTPAIHKYLSGMPVECDEEQEIERLTETYRSRLRDLSWFMRCLNEPIARKANAEDDCTGRFWEGRYKSQALLDEQALLSCMAYVDLNPVRAGQAETPEKSAFTSIRQRIKDNTVLEPPGEIPQNRPELLKLDKNSTKKSTLPFDFFEYLELVDWSGRAIHPKKKSAISSHTPAILKRLQINPDAFLQYANRKEKGFYHVIGKKRSIKEAVTRLGRRFLKGPTAAERLFRTVTA